MKVKKLELQGFKSFPERTRVVFHPGITAVVGPNGTGKSNIVDAMLWVLGGLRVKSIRGDRTDDVIFNGNAKKPAQAMADVVLTLGNDEEELVVSHRVFRSGEGEYRLNGKAVRLKDIQNELWKRAIGDKEYFVIEQGAIGTFVTSKPQEKRALIEEAAGTAFYKDKKRQAQNKLENTGQNLIRLEDIIAEVEKSRNSLQRQAQAANRYRRLRERIRELTGQHFQRKLRLLERLQQETGALHAAGLEKEHALTAKVKEAEKTIVSIRKEFWDLEKALEEDRERLFNIRSLGTRIEGEIERETKRAEFLTDAGRKAEAARSEIADELLHLELEIQESRNSLEVILHSRENAEQNAAGADEALKTARDRASERERTIAESRIAYLRLLQDMTEKKNGLAKTEKELEIIRRQKDKITGQIEELKNQAVDISHRIEENETDRRSFRTDLETLKQEGETREEARRQTAADAERLQGQVDALKNRRGECEHRIRALRDVVEKERSGASTEPVPGSLGLLAELIRTSSGDAPLFDVFWKEEAAALVVPAEDFLQHYRIDIKGRYLLLPRDIRSKVPDHLIRQPSVRGLLRTRLQPSERIGNRLDHMADAVVVDDVAAAVRLWLDFPEWNFITPNGDILLASGLLRLGPKPEGMIALMQEIRDLETAAAACEAELPEILERLRIARDAASGHDEEIRRLAARSIDLEKALAERDKEAGYLETERNKTRTNVEILSREIDILEGEIRSALALQDSLNVAAAALASEAETLKDRIAREESAAADGMEKDAEAERIYFELKAGLELADEKMSGLRHHLQSLEKRKQTLEARTDGLAVDAQKAEEEKTQLQDHVRNLREKAAASARDQAELEAALGERETHLHSIRRKQEEMETALESQRREEESAKEERVRHEIRKAEIERDWVNLEETCWQELKKTLAELREETASLERTEPESSGEPEETDEDPQNEDEEKSGDEPEPGRERRPGRRLVPASELSDDEVDRELEDARDLLQKYRAVNLMAEEEYVEQKTRHEFLVTQRRDLLESVASTEAAIRKIDEESKTQFLTALEQVNTNFQDVFAILFKGGNAEVKLLEPDNPLESGVEIIAQPPGKRVQNLSLLSGGEKSLTSLAFMFALFRYRPSPFCFLDEVDAALDDVNLARFLDLMKAIKTQTQFIIITHNYKTMEVADYIFGTTMEDPNITKLYSVKLEKKDDQAAVS